MKFINPKTLTPPLGLYSHLVRVAPETELFFISGQLGISADGKVADNIGAQADQVFSNIIEILQSQGLGPTDIIKLNTYMVAGHDGQKVREARLKYLGDHRPASTAIYVSGLVDEAWYVEIDVVAGKKMSDKRW